MRRKRNNNNNKKHTEIILLYWLIQQNCDQTHLHEFPSKQSNLRHIRKMLKMLQMWKKIQQNSSSWLAPEVEFMIVKGKSTAREIAQFTFFKWLDFRRLMYNTWRPHSAVSHHRTLSNATPDSLWAEGQEFIILSLNNQNGNKRTIEGEKINSYNGSKIKTSAFRRITVKVH